MPDLVLKVTCSLFYLSQDALTDLTAHSECIELEEVGDGRAHKGILQAARYIKNTLNNMQLLETAFQRGQVSDVTGTALCCLCYLCYLCYLQNLQNLP